MSVYKKATLAQIPSGYKASTAKLYSVVPNSTEGDFTVSSVADATRINEEGLIEKVSLNQARLSRNFIDGEVQPDPFLLLEPTRTNLITRSEEFDNAAWTKSNCTVDANQTIAPDGSNSAEKLNTNFNSQLYQIISAANGQYTLSIFAKIGSLNSFTLAISDNTYGDVYATFDLLNESYIGGANTGWTYNSASIEKYTNDWYKCTVTGTNTLTTTQKIHIVRGVSSGYIYIWGAQLEAGSYPSSYIPTTTATVTRTQDSCKIQPFSGLATDYPITVYGKIEIQEKFASFISIGNSTNEFKYLSVSTGTGGVNVVRRNTPNDTDFYTFSYSIGDIIKFAIKYTSNTAYKLYINGSLIGNVTSGDDVDFDFNSVLLGQLRNSDTLRNPIYEAMIFNEALSDSELQALTS